MDMEPATGKAATKEAMGWMSLVIIMFAFPALFFLCVFFPIWMGWTPRP
jgi:hypothetical protein